MNFQLCLVADPNFCTYQPLTAVVEQAVAAGVTWVQLRNKTAPVEQILEQAFALSEVLEKTKTPLIINDHIEIALEVNAAGVHLGQSDESVIVAREKLGTEKIIGLSIEKMAQFDAVPSKRINYLGVGPVFTTQSKDCPVIPWGLQQVSLAASQTSLPLVAIGGIDGSNLAKVMQTGVAGVAVLSAICSAKDPFLATTHLMDEILCQPT